MSYQALEESFHITKWKKANLKRLHTVIPTRGHSDKGKTSETMKSSVTGRGWRVRELNRQSTVARLYVRICFVRNCQTVFQGGCTIFHSHQQWRQPSLLLHMLANIWCVSWILAILIGVWWYLIVLICISWWHMMKRIYFHMLLCHLCLFGEVSRFPVRFLIPFVCVCVLSILCIFWINLLLNVLQIFSPSLWLVF